MGAGDELMCTGMARGAKARGKRIAFGDGRKIIWSEHSWSIFRNNPNIADPGSEHDDDIEWINDYRGHRLYHTNGCENGRWSFNPDFRAVPGEIFFDQRELAGADGLADFDVVVEPNVKASAPNKQWGFEKWQRLATQLRAQGLRVVQFVGPYTRRLEGVRAIHTVTFRDALALLRRAKLYIGPEGGLHHGAAAMNVPGVVIFGGFTHPRNTGYFIHTNIFRGDEPCGQTAPCQHCRAIMDSIPVSAVHDAVMERLC